MIFSTRRITRSKASIDPVFTFEPVSFRASRQYLLELTVYSINAATKIRARIDVWCFDKLYKKYVSEIIESGGKNRFTEFLWFVDMGVCIRF